MDDYSRMSTPLLQEEIERQQMHFGVITGGLRGNRVYTPAEAEKFSKGVMRRIKVVTDRVLAIAETLRERKQPIQLARLEHWHPIIQAVMVSKFKKSKEPLIRKIVHGMKQSFQKTPAGIQAAKQSPD